MDVIARWDSRVTGLQISVGHTIVQEKFTTATCFYARTTLTKRGSFAGLRSDGMSSTHPSVRSRSTLGGVLLLLLLLMFVHDENIWLLFVYLHPGLISIHGTAHVGLLLLLWERSTHGARSMMPLVGR